MLEDPDPALATFPITRERLQGYRDAADTPLRVAVCAPNSAAEGKALTAGLLAGAEPPDAIAAISDELALGALEAATEAGIELALTGWADTPAAAPAGLTTVSAVTARAGRRLRARRARPATRHRRAPVARGPAGLDALVGSSSRDRRPRRRHLGTSWSISTGMLSTLTNDVASYSSPDSGRKMSRPSRLTARRL